MALVLAAFVMALAAFVVAIATLVLVCAALMLVCAALVIAFAAGSLTGFCLAAILGASVYEGLAIVGSAGGVFASALVVAMMLMFAADLGRICCGLFGSIFVAAGGHTESKSDSGNSG